MKAQVELTTLGAWPPANVLAMAGYVELEAAGFGEGRSTVYPTEECLMVQVMPEASRDWILAGVLVFNEDKGMRRIWISLSYVKPEFRGIGVYRKLYEALCGIAFERKVRTIESGTHTKNTAMRAAAKRLGRTESQVILTHELPVDPTIIE